MVPWSQLSSRALGLALQRRVEGLGAMARSDDERSGALRQLVVGVEPPEDDALEYVVHRFNEGMSNPELAARPTRGPDRVLGATRHRSSAMCQDWRVAQSEREPEQSQIGDAVLDTMRGAMRILGGVVKMAAGMTRLFAVAVLKAAAAAERAVEASEADEEKPAPKPKPRNSRPGEPGLS
jgi:hypothetical protein